MPKCCPEDQVLSKSTEMSHGYKCIASSDSNTKPDFKVLKYFMEKSPENITRPFSHPNSSCTDECGFPRCEGLDGIGDWTYERLEETNWQAVVVYEEKKDLLVLKINETSVRPQNTMIKNDQ